MKMFLQRSCAWVRVRLASAVFALIGIYAAMLAMRQSYHFGHGLGVSEVGKESYAQWLTLIDVATALLPIATVVMWRLGSKRSSVALALATVLFTAFSISNQIGFGAAERLGESARVAAINKAYAEAKADQKQLRDGTIAWLKGTATNRGVLKSSRMESIASTERLIASAGTIDPSKVYAVPTDIQATSLATLVHRWTPWSTTVEDVALFLVVGVAILGILTKPIFLGLAAYFYNRKLATSANAKKKETTEAGLRSVSPEAKNQTPREPTSAPDHDALAAGDVRSPLVATGEHEPTGTILGGADDKPPEPAQVSQAEVPVVPLRSFLVGEEATSNLIPFKGRDTRRHATSSDGHVEEFVKILSSETQGGDSLPFRSTVWDRYRRFCAENNLRHMHDKALSSALARYGAIRHRPTGGSVYIKLPRDLDKNVIANRKFFAVEDSAAIAH